MSSYGCGYNFIVCLSIYTIQFYIYSQQCYQVYVINTAKHISLYIWSVFEMLNCYNFCKMHGTGNNFILVQSKNESEQQLVALAKRICNSNFGVGADGLLMIYPPEKAQTSHDNNKQLNSPYFHMKIINRDGSSAKMCGNGLRCFAALLYKKQQQKQNEFTVSTDSGYKDIIVQQGIHQCDYNVYVEMGLRNNQTVQDMTAFVVNLMPQLKQDLIYAYYVLFNVPHLVINLKSKFTNNLREEQICRYGQTIQQKINANINFVWLQTIDGHHEMHATTFQRGAGLTYSCGTGVCSAYLIALHKQSINSQITNNLTKIHTKGGSLQLSLKQKQTIVMKGGANIICEGKFYM